MPKSRISAILFLTLIAAPPRFLNLGRLSFYGDEETSAIPARSLAEGEGSRMPSGMAYRRALPLTVVNAQIARVVGLDSELSYRLSSAVLGTASVPLLYVVGGAMVAPPAAFTAALALAVSEWHISYSRRARMYSPFLFFFIVSVWTLFRWSTGPTRSPSTLLVAVGAFAISVTLHGLGILALLILGTSLLVASLNRRSVLTLSLVFGVLVAAAYAYGHFFVNAAYDFASRPSEVTAATVIQGSFWKLGNVGLNPLIGGLAVAGMVVGVWAGLVTCPDDRCGGWKVRSSARISLGALAGAMSYTGNLYALGLVVAITALMRPSPRVGRGQLSVLIALFIPASLWLGYAVTLAGEPVSALKALLSFPFPYPVGLAQISPGLALLFVGSLAWLGFQGRDSANDGSRVISIAVIVALAGIGMARPWGGTRYFLPFYPFVLLSVCQFLVVMSNRVLGKISSFRWSYVTVALVVVSGVLGGHGIRAAIRQVTVDHGARLNPYIDGFPIRPDHRSAGLFVRRMRSDDDMVIAEDPLEQWWYTKSPIDYWLRSREDSRPYLYQGDDGAARDIYVSSALVSDPASLKNVRGRLWLITSAETYAERSYYLDPGQRTWLDSIERSIMPSFIARDGVTKVYCVNCRQTNPD